MEVTPRQTFVTIDRPQTSWPGPFVLVGENYRRRATWVNCAGCGRLVAKDIHGRTNNRTKTISDAYCSKSCAASHRIPKTHPCVMCGHPIPASKKRESCSPRCFRRLTRRNRLAAGQTPLRNYTRARGLPNTPEALSCSKCHRPQHWDFYGQALVRLVPKNGDLHDGRHRNQLPLCRHCYGQTHPLRGVWRYLNLDNPNKTVDKQPQPVIH